MNKISTSVALALACAGLAACGGPDHPKRPRPGPGGVMVAPPASPSIHFTASDSTGNKMTLEIECGVDSTIKDCADVNKSIIDKITQMKPGSKNK